MKLKHIKLFENYNQDVKKVEELFKDISNCLEIFRKYSTFKVLKYHFQNKPHEPKGNEQTYQFHDIIDTPLHIILENPSAYDYTGTSSDIIENFKIDYDKYAMVYTSKKDISKLSEEDIKSAISGAYNFLSRIKKFITVEDVVGNEYRSYQIEKNDYAKKFKSYYEKLENSYKSF